jgi:hypothetical protein
METTVTQQFVILSLHPERGRIRIDNTHFRYSLIGAVLMDFLNNGELSMNNKRLVPSFRKNGEEVHDTFAEVMERPANPKRVSYWIRRLSMKSRFVFRGTTAQLIHRGILRHEKKYFLNIIPYNCYYISDERFRKEIIDSLREVLLNNKQSVREQRMMIGLIAASRAFRLLAYEPGEKRTIRLKCKEFMKNDEMSSEINQVIREVQSSIAASIAASAAAGA